MTNDEAKSVLFDMLGKGIHVENTKENQAILAALRALEQESILDKLRAEIEQRPYGIANDSVIRGMSYERTAILKIIDKYREVQEK